MQSPKLKTPLIFKLIPLFIGIVIIITVTFWGTVIYYGGQAISNPDITMESIGESVGETTGSFMKGLNEGIEKSKDEPTKND